MKNVIVIVLSVFVLCGCSVKQKVSKTADSAMMPVDDAKLSINKGVESSIYSAKKGTKVLSGWFGELKNSFYETGVMQFVLSDAAIDANRQNYILWDGSGRFLAKQIIQNSYPDYSYDALSLFQKQQLVFEYYMKEAQKNYKQQTLQKHPVPKPDEFLSDRENLQLFHQHSLKMHRAQLEWELNFKTYEKQVMQKTIAALYGAMEIENLRYDPHGEKLYMQIQSAHNGFETIVYIKQDSEGAKKIRNNPDLLQPVVYFDIKNAVREYVGTSIKQGDALYIAQESEDNFVRDEEFSIEYNGETVFDSQEIATYGVPKNVTPPKWYGEAADTDAGVYWGYGVSTDAAQAKDLARADLANAIQVTVDSKAVSSTQSSGNDVSSSYKQDVSLVSKDIVLQDTTTPKNEMKDGYWYTKAQYIVPKPKPQ